MKGGNKPKVMKPAPKPTKAPVKMACGGAAKSRKGFPDTFPVPKKGK